MTLGELKIGDKFIAASDKKGLKKYKVTGKPQFNIRHGRPTIDCVLIMTGVVHSKSSSLEVIKLPIPTNQ